MTRQRFIILGASGVIGHQLMAECVARNMPVLGTAYRHEAPPLVSFDLRKDRLLKLVPDLSEKDRVYLLAAYVDPNWIFARPGEAAELNIEASLGVVEELLACGAKLVFLSTELVFDGQRGGYVETDVPNPTTLYGRQKWEVEQRLIRSRGRWCIVRTGAVVSFRPGDNCPVAKTYLSLLRPGACMAYDNRFSLTDVRDLCRGLVELSSPNYQGIYHLAAAPPITRTELAELIQETSRYAERMNYRPVPFAQIPYPETRPLRSWLVNTKAVRELGISFAPPRQIVEAKVALLDHWQEKGEQGEPN